MDDFLCRTRNLIGEVALEKLKKSRVMLVGVGGVGSFTAEALARVGIGSFVLVDGDVVNVSNINRQLIATHSTIQKYKVDVMKERILDINPSSSVVAEKKYIDTPNLSDWEFSNFDYVIDAIDSVSSKISIIVKARDEGTKIISCMGTGNKLDARRFKVSDIYDTSVCPLARVMRRELKKRGVDKLKVLYSDEEPVISGIVDGKLSRKVIPSSISFVPSVAGLLIAGEVVKDLIYS